MRRTNLDDNASHVDQAAGDDGHTTAQSVSEVASDERACQVVISSRSSQARVDDKPKKVPADKMETMRD